jgi:hypothetical protein
MSADEQALLIAGIGYFVVVAVWAVTLNARARIMLGALSELIDPSLWQRLGAPTSVTAAMRDPERRWFRFVRSGEYRQQCSETVVALIDDFRRRTKRMLLVLAVAGVLLLFRFWPLLKPNFL